MKKSVFIGIDVSKDTLDAAIHSTKASEKFIIKQFLNSKEGFKNILSWIKASNYRIEDCFFCMEHTGLYSLPLAVFLYEKGISVSMVPALEIKRSIGIARGKNDIVDARRIAAFAMEKYAKLKLYRPLSESLIKIKQLLSFRDQQRRICSSLKNSRCSHKRYAAETGLDSVVQSLNEQIIEIEKTISLVDKQIAQIIKNDDDLRKNHELATSVKGIGLIVSSYILVTTSNFSNFSSARQYCCYSGVAPFEYTSGTSIKGKTRVSHLANKRIKTLLHNAANSAVLYDAEIRNYFKRKEADGKNEKLIMNAICNKLIHRVFAVVKRQSPYVSLYKEVF